MDRLKLAQDIATKLDKLVARYNPKLSRVEEYWVTWHFKVAAGESMEIVANALAKKLGIQVYNPKPGTKSSNFELQGSKFTVNVGNNLTKGYVELGIEPV